ncbi:hypothetical protein AA0312_1696 [Acetobacter tropicalis NRIC 0312]|uniref:hypothetical protein n=1 Tax=Acetobacter tropicalis TaxID=104102 RepID=UPI0005AFA055|nr:hypothetical protein [Acetobacter tropicalis]KXV47072.1 hypothetical protein AD944_12590 [Acetobacter tropicalis]GAL97691.1 hypothetical protein ATR1_069d0001 [Acetobacter tropicalis]GBR70122.1 hypothetical protein AA0312_1696 [Acetobacter tropicalis NRIC 0312]
MALRRKHTLAVTLLSAILVWGAASLPIAAEATSSAAATQSGKKPEASYWHNWTDARGVSHMTKCTFHTYALKSRYR